jgi:DNA-binding response OmpR family regulator
MPRQAIYLHSGEPDIAILRGLSSAGTEVMHTRTISDTLAAMAGAEGGALLVAEVQAGAIALLSLIREQRGQAPGLVMLYDREGKDIHTAIKALQLGVREYLLRGDAEAHRELSARLMAERANSQAVPSAHAEARASSPKQLDPAAQAAEDAGLRWDPATHLIHIGSDYVRLSPVEGRIFDLLLTHRNRVVSMRELIEYALIKPEASNKDGAKLLRPHLVRLRSKLERQPGLSRRIVNMRGSGYMMI